MAATSALTKSLFVAGVQCHKLLWWKAHDPGALELQPSKVLADRFDQGRQVGELARAEFPGGVLIAGQQAVEDRVRATQEAIAGGAHTIYEGAFTAGGVRVAVDVLTRTKTKTEDRSSESWRLVEAKMTSSQKEEHIPDAAVQLHVVEASGLDVALVDIMHLNPEFRHPDQGKLLMSTDVTAATREMLPTIQPEVDTQAAMLNGPLPDVPIGRHCAEPRECVFVKRCWPQNADHISKLYYFGIKKASDMMDRGIHSVWQIPATERGIRAPAKRQMRSMKEGRMIVEPTLAEALKEFDVKLGFLDFETINRAVPVWPGMKPHEAGPAQFSYHEANGDGTYRHAEFLAEGPQDARPELARQMVEATRGAERLVTYSGYEKARIRGLMEIVPALKDELAVLEAKLLDLLPVVRDHVYLPEFGGSFSIKDVLHPLVPDLSYSDLIIVDGLTASVAIARLLFVSGKIRPEEHARVRKDLLSYCERDTWAMVRLLGQLRNLVAL